MHSIHYLDLIRSLIGEPRGVYCKGVRHPGMPDYSDTRTSIVLDYGDTIRCSLTMNHAHTFGGRYGMSQLKIEGMRGAAIAKMGVNLNYPAGEPDTLEFATEDSNGWSAIALRGDDEASAPSETPSAAPSTVLLAITAPSNENSE